MAHMEHSLELGCSVKRFMEPPYAIADILGDDVAGVALQRGVPVPWLLFLCSFASSVSCECEVL